MTRCAAMGKMTGFTAKPVMTRFMAVLETTNSPAVLEDYAEDLTMAQFEVV